MIVGAALLFEQRRAARIDDRDLVRIECLRVLDDAEPGPLFLKDSAVRP